MYKRAMIGMALVTATLSVQTTASTPAAFTLCSRLDETLSESQKVEHLIQFIRDLRGATFIRNGSEHNCGDAAQHLLSKWEKHKGEIRTAKEFIENIASASGMTGQAYMVRLADGTEITTKEMLTQELQRLEQ